MTTSLESKPRLVLIRGLPGSGKSTMAQAMTDHVHFEADMYFMSDGVYTYDASKIGAAHEWCRAEMTKALAAGKNVVILNTFSRLHEMQKYIDSAKELGVEVTVIEATGSWPNTHGVPAERVEQMRQRWEKMPDRC